MRLEQLTIILEVARVGSMSQAAKNLSLSQPSLSTAIASLEKELGLKLFNRSSRGITPTPSGQEVLDIAQSFFDQMRQLRQLAPENTRQPERLEIAASPSAASTFCLRLSVNSASFILMYRSPFPSAVFLSFWKRWPTHQISLA